MIKKLALTFFGMWILTLAVNKILLPEVNPPKLYVGTILSAEADKILKASCFDCHSNESKFPWYGNMPLVGAMVGMHIRKGRDHLNFSHWDSMSIKQKAHAIEETFEEIEEGEMPIKGYLWTHKEATLTPDKVTLLKSSVPAELQAAIAANKDKSPDHDHEEGKGQDNEEGKMVSEANLEKKHDNSNVRHDRK